MTPTIEKLLRVQDYDIRIAGLRKEHDSIPEHMRSLERRLDSHRENVNAAREKSKSVQAAIKELELEVESQDAKIRKLREQQMQLKSNKEFKAMEAEIIAVQGEIKAIEERIIGRMEELEKIQAEIKGANQDLSDSDKTLKNDLEIMSQSAGKLSGEIEKLTAERAALAESCDPVWLKCYDRIFSNRKDKVLVPVENTSCGGCHMRLPPYLVHEARKQAEIVSCSFCGRMLFDG